MKNKDFAHLVRPILTLLMAFAFVLAIFMRMLDAVYLAWAFTGIIIFWFGERAFRNFATLGTTLTQPAQPVVVSPPTAPEMPEPALEEAPVLEKPPPGITPPETEPPPAPKRKTYWEMTPEEAEAEFLSYWDVKAEEAKKTYEEFKDLPDKEMVKTLKDIWDNYVHSKVVSQSLISVIKEGRAAPYSLGPVGYRISGVPEAEIPDWAKLYLKNNP